MFSFLLDRIALPAAFALAAVNLKASGWNWIDGTSFVALGFCIVVLAICDYREI